MPIMGPISYPTGKKKKRQSFFFAKKKKKLRKFFIFTVFLSSRLELYLKLHVNGRQVVGNRNDQRKAEKENGLTI